MTLLIQELELTTTGSTALTELLKSPRLAARLSADLQVQLTTAVVSGHSAVNTHSLVGTAPHESLSIDS